MSSDHGNVTNSLLNVSSGHVNVSDSLFKMSLEHVDVSKIWFKRGHRNTDRPLSLHMSQISHVSNEDLGTGAAVWRNVPGPGMSS